MKRTQSILAAAALTLTLSTVSFGGTITGSRTSSVGTITGSRAGTITGSAAGTITGSRAGTITGSSAGTITGSRNVVEAEVQENLMVRAMRLILMFLW